MHFIFTVGYTNSEKVKTNNNVKNGKYTENKPVTKSQAQKNGRKKINAEKKVKKNIPVLHTQSTSSLKHKNRDRKHNTTQEMKYSEATWWMVTEK